MQIIIVDHLVSTIAIQTRPDCDSYEHWLISIVGCDNIDSIIQKYHFIYFQNLNIQEIMLL